MRASYLIKGIARNIPGYRYLTNTRESTGGTCDARYCYSIWLRHVVLAFENGHTTIPKAIAELGPGDSLGAGLSALILGSEKYYALDVVRFTNEEVNLKIFDDLVKLFKARAAIPDETEYPFVKPYLKDYSFPHHIFSESYLEEALNEKRLDRIRRAIRLINSEDEEDKMIVYRAPWHSASIIPAKTLDMVFSQAVMQHVDDLPTTYRLFSTWLKPGGLASHQIDFKSMNALETWDKHWEYSDVEWKLLKLGKVYIINREPHSTYIYLSRKNNLRIICDLKIISAATPEKQKVAKRFRDNPLEDFTISGAFIQAIKEN
jgi:hypothetical protein